MANIEQKIKEVTEKIEENCSKKSLSDKEGRKLLMNINKDLLEIKKSAEGEKQKEIVENKVKELRETINENLSGEALGWGIIKTLLRDDIKDGLEELKSEIVEAEEKSKKSLALIPATVEEYEPENVERELDKWRSLFPGKTPEQAYEILGKMFQGLIDYKRNSDELQKDLVEAKNSGSSDFYLEFGDRITKRGMEMSELGGKIGNEVMPLVGHAAGTWVGTAAGLGTVWVGTAGYFANKGMNTGRELVEEAGGGAVDLAKTSMVYVNEARKDGKEFVERIADNTKELFMGVTANAAEVSKSFFDIFKSESKSLDEKIKASKEFIKILQERVENRDKQLEKLEEEFNQRLKRRDGLLEEQKEEFNRQLKDMKEWIEKKDKRIEVLEEKIEKLETKNENLQKEKEALLIAQVEVGNN